MRRATFFAAVLLSVVPVLASEPGQPLDCSDWVIVEPGISCITLIAYPCQEAYACDSYGPSIDNEGNAFVLKFAAVIGHCGANGFQLARWEVVRFSPSGQASVVAYLDDRCLPDG